MNGWGGFMIEEQDVPHVLSAWGARGIYHSGYPVDWLYDRAGWITERVDPALQMLIKGWLDKLNEIVLNNYVATDSSEVFTFEQDAGDGIIYKFAASPNASYGYMYAAAWSRFIEVIEKGAA